MCFRAVRWITGAALVLASITAHADVVKLTGNRVLAVVGLTPAGANAVLTLDDGSSITVPISDVQSITPEPVGTRVCAASPYRCQDRALLLGRHAQAQASAGAVGGANRRPVVP